ncbi:MAG: [Fe-Fe] hydrogenase large subunit C-terminal domain-containing protein [Candidatus Krumholzibacteriaceae bacterium]|jgi:Na+-translocating ferredoxin:NAD+ oxidoreductase RNF subunit RnfB
MVDLRHGFRIDPDKCDGRMSCMRTCPTHAIRVKNGKARLISELCIDCGLCLGVCTTGAISATTIRFAELNRFKYKVAVASPALFTQFGMRDTPAQVARALLELGFDAVWEYAVDIALIDRAITDCVKTWPGPFPLISNSCPVVVRLIQVAYPSMVEHVIPLEAPREIAARELKRKYSEELGLKPEEIAAIYITSCQAKAISILQPAEEAKSYLDGAVSIAGIYNELLTKMRKNAKPPDAPKDAVNSSELLHWGAPEGEFPKLSREHYLPLTGLTGIMKVFNDIEKGRFRNIEFLECHACQGGCIGGNLAVENVYVARSKLLHLMASMPKSDPEFEKEVERRYLQEDVSLRGSLKPRLTEGEAIDLRERVMRRKRAEEIVKALPLLNCGLCGAPTCRNHAEDVAASRGDIQDCVFLSLDRIDQLRNLYKK